MSLIKAKEEGQGVHSQKDFSQRLRIFCTSFSFSDYCLSGIAELDKKKFKYTQAQQYLKAGKKRPNRCHKKISCQGGAEDWP